MQSIICKLHSYRDYHVVELISNGRVTGPDERYSLYKWRENHLRNVRASWKKLAVRVYRTYDHDGYYTITMNERRNMGMHLLLRFIIYYRSV